MIKGEVSGNSEDENQGLIISIRTRSVIVRGIGPRLVDQDRPPVLDSGGDGAVMLTRVQELVRSGNSASDGEDDRT